MKLVVHHFIRKDNLAVSVYAPATSSDEDVLADVTARHGEVTKVIDRTDNTRIVPDWKGIGRGFKQGKITKVGR